MHPTLEAATDPTTGVDPFWLAFAAAVLAVLAAATGFVLWRYAERDTVDARADADHWRLQHQAVTGQLVQARAEVTALRQQLAAHLPVETAWVDEDQPDSLPTLIREPTGAVPVLDAEPRLWTGGQATMHVQPDPSPGAQEALPALPAGLTAAQATAAARWHRGGKTWAEVGDLLGVSATTAARAAARADAL